MQPDGGRSQPNTRRGQGIWQIAAGTLISLAFLWLAFRGIDWQAAWEPIAHANGWMLVLALGSVLLGTFIRSERWRIMFYPNHRALRRTKFFSIFLIGQVINAAIPARVGELARAYLIGEVEHVGKAQALWTTVAEKVWDSLALLLFLALISFSVPLPIWLKEAGWTLTAALGAALGALALAVVYQSRATRWIEWLSARLAWTRRLRLSRLFAVVVDSLRLTWQSRLFFGLLAWSIVAFGVTAATNWISARALGLHLPYTACILLLVVLQISAVVPIPTSPGRVGLFHYLCVITLSLFGIERDAAFSYSLILHLLTYLPMAVGGPFCLWLENYDWRGLSRLIGKERAPASPDQPATIAHKIETT